MTHTPVFSERNFPLHRRSSVVDLDFLEEQKSNPSSLGSLSSATLKLIECPLCKEVLSEPVVSNGKDYCGICLFTFARKHDGVDPSGQKVDLNNLQRSSDLV